MSPYTTQLWARGPRFCSYHVIVTSLMDQTTAKRNLWLYSCRCPLSRLLPCGRISATVHGILESVLESSIRRPVDDGIERAAGEDHGAVEHVHATRQRRLPAKRVDEIDDGDRTPARGEAEEGDEHGDARFALASLQRAQRALLLRRPHLAATRSDLSKGLEIGADDKMQGEDDEEDLHHEGVGLARVERIEAERLAGVELVESPAEERRECRDARQEPQTGHHDADVPGGEDPFVSLRSDHGDVPVDGHQRHAELGDDADSENGEAVEIAEGVRERPLAGDDDRDGERNTDNRDEDVTDGQVDDENVRHGSKGWSFVNGDAHKKVSEEGEYVDDEIQQSFDYNLSITSRLQLDSQIVSFDNCHLGLVLKNVRFCVLAERFDDVPFSQKEKALGWARYILWKSDWCLKVHVYLLSRNGVDF